MAAATRAAIATGAPAAKRAGQSFRSPTCEKSRPAKWNARPMRIPITIFAPTPPARADYSANGMARIIITIAAAGLTNLLQNAISQRVASRQFSRRCSM